MNNILVSNGQLGSEIKRLSINFSDLNFFLTSKETLDITNAIDAISTILDQKRPSDNSYKELFIFVEDRTGHDGRYAIDATKIEKTLGCQAEKIFDTGILKTIDWYLNK